MRVVGGLLALILATTAYGELAPLYRSSEPIPNHYIVKVKNNGKYVMRDLTEALLAENDRNLLKGTGFGHVKILQEMDGRYLKFLVVELDYKSLEIVRRHPDVEYVEEEGKITSDEGAEDFDGTDYYDGIELPVNDPQEIDHEGLEKVKRLLLEDLDETEDGFFGLDRINQRNSTRDFDLTFYGDGFGVNVYVINSGIRKLHREFECRARMAYDVLQTTGQDCSKGHGTPIASVAVGKNVGVAKAAKVHGIKVYDCVEEHISNYIDGMQWVAEHRATPCVVVVTLSAGKSKSVDNAAEAMVDAGCVVVVSAGRGSKNACKRSPARSPKVITVAATYKNDGKTQWSNFGSCIDIFAPGNSLTTAVNYNDEEYTHSFGTEVAAGFVAGVAAVHLGKKIEAADVKERILGDATPCVVFNEGRGSPNRMLYVDPGDGEARF